MDKIDDTKMKTKELISRRRRLEDESNIQENKIKRVREQLRKMKALCSYLILISYTSNLIT